MSSPKVRKPKTVADFPEVAAQWHPTRNGNIDPKDVSYGSDLRVWWQCEAAEDHEWEAVVSSRTITQAKCPFCANRKLAKSNCLAVVRPDLAKEWHPTKNLLKPDGIIAGGMQKAWWKCQTNPDHEWETPINRRMNGVGCPFCDGKRVCGSNSLASTYPEVAKEWHPTKNGSLKPDQVLGGGDRKVWWQCSMGHEWTAAIYNRTKGSGCPVCSNKQVHVDNCLATTHPGLAAEWHPTKNEGLTPADVVFGSAKKVWWKCPQGADHVWQTAVVNRTGINKTNKGGCPVCSNRKVVVSNSLATTHPHIASEWYSINAKPTEVVAGSNREITWRCEHGHIWDAQVYERAVLGRSCPTCATLAYTHPDLAAQWHPTKNGSLKPTDVSRGSIETVWWQCSISEDHDWQARVNARVNTNSGCPCCNNTKVVLSNCLAKTHPQLAAEWHPTKNGTLTPQDVVSGSGIKAWWKCPKGADHEFQSPIHGRATGTGCPCCLNRNVVPSNCLRSTHPQLVKQWHPTKNGSLQPDDVTAVTKRKVWWQCDQAADHVWEAFVWSRTRDGRGCPFCANQKITKSNCLAVTHPAVAAKWHPTKNVKTPNDVTAGSNDSIWWKCSVAKDHEWQSPVYRLANLEQGCPCCANKIVVRSNCLATTNPNLAAEWHPTKNDITPEMVVAGAAISVWWLCDKGHEWQQSPSVRSKGCGCPICNGGWSVERIRLFVKSILPYLKSLNQVQLYTILEQTGLLASSGKGKALVKLLASQKIGQDELEKFAKGEHSDVDDVIENIDEDDIDDDDSIDEKPTLLPTSIKDILLFLDSDIVAGMDQEAINGIIAESVWQIWQQVFNGNDIEPLRSFNGEGYSKQVKEQFLSEYNGADALVLPKLRRTNGELVCPNLMQKLTVWKLLQLKRFLNISDTGTGKTLSAIWSALSLNSKMAVILCPNDVVDYWTQQIKAAVKNSVVHQHFDFDHVGDKINFLVLNYEKFQQPDSEHSVKTLIEQHNIDLIVLDEIQMSKQRTEDISKRRGAIFGLITNAGQNNPDLHVLGMTATPVINNLREPVSLLEIVSGVQYDDIDTRPTVNNCIKVRRHLILNGLRYHDTKREQPKEQVIEIDCTDYLDDVLAVKDSMYELDQRLLEYKLPQIINHLTDKTIVYTHNVDKVVEFLASEIEKAGWKVDEYTGQTNIANRKRVLENFIDGDTQVLVASRPISVGVEGLQNVSNRQIIAILPWTDAEFKQLKGRLCRKGQTKEVEVFIPTTYATVGGKKWSWDGMRLKRIRNKQTVADAAVDGRLPDEHLRTPAQAYADCIKWLDRLNRGELLDVRRRKIHVDLTDAVIEKRQKKFGDFFQMNIRLNKMNSSKAHSRLLRNPSEFELYHALFRKEAANWDVVPWKEIFKWCDPEDVIGDFGCGEAHIAAALPNSKVCSFDHVAVNDNVVACDIANVPLPDEFLDTAIFSLSLMGANVVDYIKEAHRCLKDDGNLFVAESTARFQNIKEFIGSLRKLGFEVYYERRRSMFTFLKARKIGVSDSKAGLKFAA